MKYPGHECNMDRPVPPPCCLWVMWLSCHHCRWVGPGLSCWAIIRPWSWWAVGHLPVLFGPALADPGWPMVLCPLCLPVLWVALLRGWLVCCGCDVLWGPSFPNYLLHCNSWWSGSLLFVRHPCALHLNAFVLNIDTYCSAILEELYF